MTLNRPEKKNALSTALRDELLEALIHLENNEDLKVLILTGDDSPDVRSVVQLELLRIAIKLVQPGPRVGESDATLT